MGDSFRDLLRRHRKAAGLTQEALAERAGLSSQAVGALERGDRRFPYRDTVARLAEALVLTGGERAQFAAAASRRGRSGATAAAARSLPAQLPADVPGRPVDLAAFDRPADPADAGRTAISARAPHLVRGQPCASTAQWRALAERKLPEIDRLIDELRSLREAVAACLAAGCLPLSACRPHAVDDAS